MDIPKIGSGHTKNIPEHIEENLPELLNKVKESYRQARENYLPFIDGENDPFNTYSSLSNLLYENNN